MAIQRKITGITLILFAMLAMFSSCSLFNDNEVTDKKETITLYVSAETGTRYGMTGKAYECMLVKEKGQDSWNPWDFKGISGFTYERGIEYELLVTKTTYANPPADGGSYDYELIRVVKKTSPDAQASLPS